jgi:crotonobetainyl-CoA:carnitine CoA-transferase CaiB-like acyl-CoA transferase
MLLPLSGIRVIDLSRLLPGPFCSQLLADFGADVVKVEDLGSGDYARWAKPDGAFFTALNRNKRSVRLDLKHPGGREAFLALLDGADVVLESYRPGTLERLGLGHDRLLARRPGLVICALTGYGQDGPYRMRAGHDLNYLAATGVLDVSGDAGAPPAIAGVQIADVGGGALMAAFGILIALRHREATGEGQVVDVSMAHGALSWLGPLAAEAAVGCPPQRGRLALGGGAICYRTYAASDGRYVALAALEPKFFEAFCRGAGCDHLVPHQFDPPGSSAHAALQAVFATRTLEEWEAFGVQHDCCLEPVRTLEEALRSPLVRDRGMVVNLGGVDVLGTPVVLSRTPARHDRRPVPALGEHTDEVLEEAGLTAVQISALREDGAIGGPERGIAGSFLS